MKGNDKHKKSVLGWFLQYSGNKMTNLERNAFERELQKDPFSKEASEGFATMNPEEVEKDLSELKKRLGARTKRKQRFVYYRIAASVAVLVAIISIFIILEKNRSSKEAGKIKNDQVALAIPESAPLIKPSDKSEIKEKVSVPEEKKVNESAPVAAVRKAEKEESPPVAGIPEGEKIAENNVAFDNRQADSANVLVAVGYGTEKSRDITVRGVVAKIQMEKKVSESEFNHAEPAQGRKDFERYIEENLRRPDVLKEGEKAIVLMTFIVRSNGIMDSIKIIRSPGPPFSDEAMRLIREGPAWKPSNKNGSSVDEEVKISIVFK
jgi:hypothetical protein